MVVVVASGVVPKRGEGKGIDRMQHTIKMSPSLVIQSDKKINVKMLQPELPLVQGIAYVWMDNV